HGPVADSAVSAVVLTVVLSLPAAHRHLHSFPTRRSSDLAESPRRLFAVAADLGEDLEDPPRLRGRLALRALAHLVRLEEFRWQVDRKSTRLNSSHVKISYAVFCLKKKNN